MAKPADAGATATPELVRLITAVLPCDGGGRELRFHPFLTVVADGPSHLGDWVAALLGADGPPETLLEVAGIRARACELQPALRATARPFPLRVEALELLGARMLARRAGSGGDVPAVRRLGDELARWERVLREARNRLARANDRAPQVDPVDIAEASRLRDEWRYAVHIDAQQHRRRSRLDADARRDHYQRFLARFGVSSFEELSMIGTGFGDTTGDVAIREAATVVSMAEQRCAQLRAALDAEDEADPPESHTGAAATEPKLYRLESLTADEAAELLARVLDRRERGAYLAPLVVDRVLDAFNPVARRRAYDRLLAYSRERQVVVVTTCDQVAQWAAAGAAGDAALALGGVPASTPG